MIKRWLRWRRERGQRMQAAFDAKIKAIEYKERVADSINTRTALIKLDRSEVPFSL